MDDRSVGLVAEVHMMEGDAAFDLAELLGLGGFVLDLVLAQELEHATERSSHRLDARGGLRDVLQRLREQAHVDHERDDDAERDDPLEGEDGAHDADHHVGEVADEDHERHHEAREERGLPVGVAVVVVALVEDVSRPVLTVAGLHDVEATVHLLDLCVDAAEHGLLAGEVGLRLHDHEGHEYHAQQRRDEGGDRHDPVGREHHDHRADERGDAAHDRRKALVHRGARGVDVVGDAREHVSRGGRVEIAQGQAVDLLGDVAPQALGDALRDRCHDEALDVVAREPDDVENDEQDAETADLSEVEGTREPGRDEVRHVAELGGADEVQDGAHEREDAGDDDRDLEGPDVTEELLERTDDVGVPLDGNAVPGSWHGVRHVPTPPSKAASSRSPDRSRSSS